MSDPAFAAADWGTTSFRLWLMDRDGQPLAERRSGEGMATAIASGFEPILETYLESLDAPDNLPVVICGMAGARQGWLEAPYVDVPSPLTGIAGGAVRIPDTGRDVRILPGLAKRDASAADVMRGEETQLLGALAAVDSSGPDTLFCMPGTHSKWVRVSSGAVTGFSTFMTGELFAIMAQHSILSHAVKDAGPVSADNHCFAKAVRQALSAPESLTSKMFGIRGGQLLFDASASDSSATLSGLLIGAELTGSGAKGGDAVTLIASGRMAALYSAALDAAEISHDTVDAEDAVRRGLASAAREIWPDRMGEFRS